MASTLPFAVDVPAQQVIYLDKELGRHEFQQVMGRVGRRFSHEHDAVLTEKTYGLVVDYHSATVFPEGEPSSREAVSERTMQPPQSDAPDDVPTLCIQAESHFAGRDLDDVRDCANVFRPDPDSGEHFDDGAFRQFNADYRRLSLAMDRILPDPDMLPYVIRLARLTEIRGYVRALYLREGADQVWTQCRCQGERIPQSAHGHRSATIAGATITGGRSVRQKDKRTSPCLRPRLWSWSMRCGRS